MDPLTVSRTDEEQDRGTAHGMTSVQAHYCPSILDNTAINCTTIPVVSIRSRPTSGPIIGRVQFIVPGGGTGDLVPDVTEPALRKLPSVVSCQIARRQRKMVSPFAKFGLHLFVFVLRFLTSQFLFTQPAYYVAPEDIVLTCTHHVRRQYHKPRRDLQYLP